jgi:hypothetical protein
MDAKELNHMIAEAYSRDLQKPELVSFKEVSRWGRKYGFPVVCTLADESEEKQIHWAASLLIQVAGTWPREDMPELLTPERGSALFNDAMQLLANGLGAANQLCADSTNLVNKRPSWPFFFVKFVLTEP